MFIHILILMYFQIFTLAFGTTHSKLYTAIHSYEHIKPLPYILTCIPSCMQIPIQTIAHFSTNTVILTTHTGICIHSHSTNLIWLYPTHIITYVYTSVHVVTCTAFLVTNMHFIGMHHNGVNYFYCSN